MSDPELQCQLSSKSWGTVWLLGTIWASILGGNSIALRSWLSEMWIPVWVCIVNQTRSKQWAPVTSWRTLWELLTPSSRRTWPRLQGFQMWVQAGKVLLPRWWRYFVFNIHTEPTHKANGSKQHGKPFWRINYHPSFFLGHWNPGPI